MPRVEQLLAAVPDLVLFWHQTTYHLRYWSTSSIRHAFLSWWLACLTVHRSERPVESTRRVSTAILATIVGVLGARPEDEATALPPARYTPTAPSRFPTVQTAAPVTWACCCGRDWRRRVSIWPMRRRRLVVGWPVASRGCAADELRNSAWRMLRWWGRRPVVVVLVAVQVAFAVAAVALTAPGGSTHELVVITCKQ